ncbi:hypothetical protein [Bradyrhizobium elkanii]|uniref:hypothetical protein n=1 Tax=Bradyrhizobium elkanii TaxID=29448 RepID=UPI00272CC5EE|nr:hypothetical protein [Bradyrhizobium elkanii]WLA80284.1 hypothetical protein QNJ99_33600 [Bradyrhizobium elkanii]
MALTTRVDPLNIDYNLLIDETLSSEAQSQAFADAAGQIIDDAKQQNQSVLGKVPPYTVAVDGRIGAPLSSVKPDGMVFVEFELVFEALDWIGDMLKQYSPYRSGRYLQSHVLLADNVAVDEGAVPPIAEQYAWVNLQPYARKIERGLSSQRPDGVYQAVAELASSTSKFGNVARIKFGYITPQFGAIDQWASSPAGVAWARKKSRRRPELHGEWLRRQPAIIITL